MGRIKFPFNNYDAFRSVKVSVQKVNSGYALFLPF
jgi:hypothetical protein